MKKAALLFILAFFVIAIAGCETVKGAADGARIDFQTAQQETTKCWQALKSIDDWVQKHFW